MAAEQFIARALQDVVQEVRIQSLTKHVRAFHGEGTTKFQNWLQDMDQLSATCDSERMCVLSTLTLGGTAGTFVTRFMRENPQTTWAVLRKTLKERFSETTDPFLVQERVRRLTQRKGESVQNYAERIRVAAGEAYENLGSAEAQQLLVETFRKGVVSDHLARNLIRKKFATLEEAVKYATDEQQTDRTLEMYRHRHAPDEPMEIDVVQQKAETEKLEQLAKNVQDLTKKLDRMSRQVQRPNPQAPQQRSRTAPPRSYPPHPQSAPAQRVWPTEQRPGAVPGVPHHPPLHHPPPPPAPVAAARYRWTEDGRPICDACGKIGHIRRHCRVPPNPQRGN